MKFFSLETHGIHHNLGSRQRERSIVDKSENWILCHALYVHITNCSFFLFFFFVNNELVKATDVPLKASRRKRKIFLKMEHGQQYTSLRFSLFFFFSIPLWKSIINSPSKHCTFALHLHKIFVKSYYSHDK